MKRFSVLRASVRKYSRFRKTLLVIGSVLVLLALLLSVTACGEKETGTTSATSAPGSSTTAAAPSETLRIGAVVWTGWPLGYDMKRGVEIMALLDNEAGGIDVGGKKYKVEFVFIESNNDQATTMSGINKLIYEEKVKYIVTDTMYPGAVFAETEKNKVISLTGCPIPTMFDPAYKYTFQGGTMMQATPEVAGWIANNVPQLKNGTVDLAFPDEAGGIGYAMGVKATLESYGIKVKEIKYPVTSTDFSAIGTQVKTDNPSAFIAVGNSAMDALIYQAVVQAGYKGLLFSTTTVTCETLKTAVPAEALEGFIGGAWPVEFDPAATEVAQVFKDKWIKVYGKWDGPEIQLTAAYAALRAALQKAGSTDVDAVAEALASGLQFEGPTGKGEMIPRNDLGISRTVDNISEFCIKKIEGGQPKLLHMITLEEGKSYLAPGILGQ
ncbi:MAG: ABC transporter substrate-binding protein [Thermoleophilia bacterium]|nr:ABC transporter substrate-binding protein [Thermoleophilia bacterium]